MEQECILVVNQLTACQSDMLYNKFEHVQGILGQSKVLVRGGAGLERSLYSDIQVDQTSLNMSRGTCMVRSKGNGHMDRMTHIQTHLKTLPSHNFVCGR